MNGSRRRRWTLRVVALAGFLALAGVTYQGVATALERREFPRPGRLVDALRLYRRVLRLGDSRSLPEKTLAHNNLAELYLRLGRLRRAALHAHQGFRLARRIRDTFRERHERPRILAARTR